MREAGAGVAVGAGVDAEEGEDGWSTVSKVTRPKVKNVTVDADSKQRAAQACNASPVSRIFHGTLRSGVSYKLKREDSVTFQQFHCLTLDVGGGISASKASLSLMSCLENYFQEESIDEGTVRKLVKLDSLPEVLILQIGRFSYDYHRNVPVKVSILPSALPTPRSLNMQAARVVSPIFRDPL
ncbi:hypothetical protein B484DRAFT_450927 [Ochromonadaceae sp. CCMP2298]|nr:hypothetical protein B484DRAFT_450927 [Ochromonadaceae sp. CCMP2298]